MKRSTVFLSHLIFMMVVATTTAQAQDSTKNLNQPPTPYYDYGACPFECCTYRNWLTTEKILVRKTHSDSSPIIATIQKKNMIRGLTGVVITANPTKLRIIKKLVIHPLEANSADVQLQPGDFVYYLHYMGEGYSKYWFKGQTFEENMFVDNNGSEEEWWAKIMMPNGKIGWIDMHNSSVQFVDACG